MAKASHPVPLHIDLNFTFFGEASESTLLAFAGLVGGTAHTGRLATVLHGLGVAGLALLPSPSQSQFLCLAGRL